MNSEQCIFPSIWKTALIMGIIALCVSPVSAGLRVDGSIYQGKGLPGATLQHIMTLTLAEDDNPTEVIIEVLGLGNVGNETATSIPAIDDTSLYSARPFITVDKTSFLLQPGKPEKLMATITLPTTVGSGGRYASINIRTLPKVSGQVKMTTSINVPILITVLDTDLIKTGKIADLQVNEPKKGRPLVVTTTFTNTGNYHFKPFNAVQILDLNGNVIANSETVQYAGSIIPTYSSQIETPIGKELPIGTYSAHSVISSDDGKKLDEITKNFEIKTPYTPPFSEVSINLNPSSSAILSTSDGKISIQFPQGCVLGSTTVTLRPVAPGDLPKAPFNVILGTTSFAVEGFTGLLSKDATLIVKYSDDDLDAAGGNAANLVLGRWDQGDDKWTLIPTSVDQGARTLTVTTNRFSIWAVMVSEGGSVAPEATKADGFTIGIVCGALALLIIATRFRKKEK